MGKSKFIAQLSLAFAVALCLHLPVWAQRPNSQQTASQRANSQPVRSPSSQRTGRPHANAPDSTRRSSGRQVVAANHEAVILADESASEWESSEPVNFCQPECTSPMQYLLDWSRCDLSIGTTAFSNPTNFLTSGSNANGQIEGNFGMQEGFNFGNCVPGLFGGQLGGQIGLRAVQTQLNGNVAGDDARNQLFFTGGLSRRVDYGVQGGLVVDYLHDDWLAVVDLSQLRGELSFAMTPCHDAGIRFTSSLNTDSASVRLAGLASPTTISLGSLDSYRFFYRCALGDEARATAEMNAGFTENRDAVLGMSLSTPLQGSVGLAATTTYLIPHSGSQPPYATESWNLGLALVWTPCRAFGCSRDYYRPLFDVADNGSLITTRR